MEGCEDTELCTCPSQENTMRALPRSLEASPLMPGLPQTPCLGISHTGSNTDNSLQWKEELAGSAGRSYMRPPPVYSFPPRPTPTCQPPLHAQQPLSPRIAQSKNEKQLKNPTGTSSCPPKPAASPAHPAQPGSNLCDAAYSDQPGAHGAHGTCSTQSGEIPCSSRWQEDSPG